MRLSHGVFRLLSLQNSRLIKGIHSFKPCALLGTLDGEDLLNDIFGGCMRPFVNRLWKDTHAQDLVEYALAAGMVAMAAVAAMPQLSATVNNVFSKIGSLINSSMA
jgi:pilus assembly protein Flp/PilA